MRIALSSFLLILTFAIKAQSFTPTEIARWQAQAKQVNIIRDNYGVPHIYGKTDADAVFGLLYAQCEDDFKRVEMNYIEKLGRLSEVRGEASLYDDLLIKLLIDSTEAVADYNKAQPWLKKLLNAYADGINFYLYKHPQLKPIMLKRFKPWYALLWTDGSIGAINTADISTAELKQFYGNDKSPIAAVAKEPDMQTGSNGFALAPSKTASGNAILYINPHVTFYFRPEVQVVSEEGLNAYGAVTWGQFFVYQGFNEHCGWMHTSSNVDVADIYAEKIVTNEKGLQYQYDGKLLPVTQKRVSIKYKQGDSLYTKVFTTFYTHHGPIMAKRDSKWLSLRSFNRSMKSIEQSWLRTKAKGFEDYKRIMYLKANTSNNTVFADDKGNIAYWHGNYMPKRDTAFNWAKPVDGTIKATEWQGLHMVDQIVHQYNPASGFLQNCNSTPFSVSGVSSPKQADYPSYMAPDGENFRGINAVRVLSQGSKYTIDKVIASGYDTKLSAFEVLIPALLKAYATSGTNYPQLQDAINVLKEWDYHSGVNSIATTLAVEWAQKLGSNVSKIYVNPGELDQVKATKLFAATATPQQLLTPLQTVLQELTMKFGKWQMAWGEVNRFQRLSGDIQSKCNDDEPSIPVPFASALWGQLPSYNSRAFAGTNKRYGVSGNSFICAVEFGKRIKAKSLLAGGESGNPNSPHFKDQAEMYTKGIFKEVLFYKEDVLKHVEQQYQPGSEQ
ncbi:penicillin acylase family protein [Parasediminibacterium paludis]|uniref:Penicillin acylase family protein n=1 Tax=Parasediminibacterium paludis TaxID=908966 RepID=A0ABV8PWR1_9BACT